MTQIRFRKTQIVSHLAWSTCGHKKSFKNKFLLNAISIITFVIKVHEIAELLGLKH